MNIILLLVPERKIMTQLLLCRNEAIFPQVKPLKHFYSVTSFNSSYWYLASSPNGSLSIFITCDIFNFFFLLFSVTKQSYKYAPFLFDHQTTFSHQSSHESHVSLVLSI